MKVLVIYNPFAGKQPVIGSFDSLIDLFQNSGYQVVFHRLQKNSSLEEFFAALKQAAAEYAKILVAGGDGTLHRVINCMLTYGIDLPVGIYPLGTCNDYARQFTGRKSFAELSQLFLTDDVTDSDVGICNEAYFTNVASLGFLIDVSQKTGQSIKNLLGPMAYYLKGLEELGKLEASQITIQCAEQNFIGEIFFMLILNGRSAGGFSKLGARASVNDGQLDVLVFKKCSLVDLATVFIDCLYGRHLHNKHILSFQTTNMRIESLKPLATDLDGEKGPQLPLEIGILPRKIKILSGPKNKK